MTAIGKYSRYALAGGQCAMLTHLATVPLDVVKTRLQVAAPGTYSGTQDAFRKIRAAQGWTGLTIGFGPTIVGYFIQGACKFGFYELFKSVAANVMSEDQVVKYKLPVYLTAGAAAEVIGSSALCPFEAIRIRMVSQPDFCSNFIGGMRKIHQQEGWKGFYKGLGPILGKQVPYTMTQFATFQYTNEFLYEYVIPKLFRTKKEKMSSGAQLAVSTTCGVAAGVVSAICSHPPDTILSRVNMQRKAGTAPPSVTSIIRELGFMGLWKGIGIRCVMVGTISGGMFLIYDSVKVLTGLPTTQNIGQKK